MWCPFEKPFLQIPAAPILDKIHQEYKDLFDTAVLRPEKMAEVDFCINSLIKPGKPRYQTVSKMLGNGIPWYFIGIVHLNEAGGKPKPFNHHLHNGDLLLDRTINVPAGRPKTHKGPFTWEESAFDALDYMDYEKVTDWTLYNQLFLFEKYNGGGYRRRGINTPYLWSYTNHYGTPPNIGKYVKDHGFQTYDHKGVPQISKQPGAAGIIIRMQQLKLI